MAAAYEAAIMHPEWPIVDVLFFGSSADRHMVLSMLLTQGPRDGVGNERQLSTDYEDWEPPAQESPSAMQPQQMISPFQQVPQNSKR